MKKTLVSALTTALVVGAASTTFAAANPFSDVPADHWAYDAVSQLAADGVIEGYGDSTFKGNRNITRYEMAQMVAKAMAKNTSGADKALVDKLAAEFAEELNNLGVRVAKLERNADMVKWNGKAEYTFQRTNVEKEADLRTNDNNLLFRLEPSAEVNNHWHVNARLDAKINMTDDAGRDNSQKVELKRIFAQGDYKNFQVRAGKMGNKIASDIVFDDTFSGIDATFGKDLKATLAYGRLNGKTVNVVSDLIGNNDSAVASAKTGSYWGVGLNYAGKSKLTARAAYQQFSLGDFYNAGPAYLDKGPKVGVWSVGAGYKFDKNFAIDAVYARGNKQIAQLDDAKINGNQKNAFSYQMSYKGAQPANKGTWGAWAAYRYLGYGAAIHPTWDVITSGQKGWEIGVKYVPLKNIVTQIQYGNGKQIGEDKKFQSIFGRVEFLF
ncbi:S-layer homology domain-containing protein [Selenomonas ruminantium]|uniref:S-layer homology domain-containing protein n=1 Tax=Selenomonas ruminantium TaxID=971 RepID=A0A1K1MYG7_SELRU|nr:S-layer homology domain-containing protein [Selenomonas ruminantium]SFW28210.1 S-layer homology domain-containing protein [Selenomonas ruminantium]